MRHVNLLLSRPHISTSCAGHSVESMSESAHPLVLAFQLNVFCCTLAAFKVDLIFKKR